MTSIEWLISVLAHNDILDHKKVSSNKQLYNLYLRLKDQAKEMHKQEIMDAYHKSFLLRDKPYSTAEKYYNETYEGKISEDAERSICPKCTSYDWNYWYSLDKMKCSDCGYTE